MDKIFGTKYRNQVKLDRTRRGWYLLLRVFWLLLPKLNFWRGDRALGYVSPQIWDFPNISLFPKIPSCYTRYYVLFNLWLIGSTLKRCKVPNYYDQDCRKISSMRLCVWPSKVSITTFALTESEFQRRFRNVFDFNHLFFQALFKIWVNNKLKL